VKGEGAAVPLNLKIVRRRAVKQCKPKKKLGQETGARGNTLIPAGKKPEREAERSRLF